MDWGCCGKRGGGGEGGWAGLRSSSMNEEFQPGSVATLSSSVLFVPCDAQGPTNSLSQF